MALFAKINTHNIYKALVILLLFIWLNFTINAIVGYNGIVEGFLLHKNIVSMGTLLDNLMREEQYLENKIARLRQPAIDTDFLEEQAGISLGYRN